MLAFATLGLCYLFPAIAYGMMLRETNQETKDRFALWYLFGTGAGCTGYWIFALVYGAIAIAFISYALQLCLLWYFYCCLKSYASKEH